MGWLTDARRQQIANDINGGELSHEEIAAKHRVSVTTVGRISSGRHRPAREQDEAYNCPTCGRPVVGNCAYCRTREYQKFVTQQRAMSGAEPIDHDDTDARRLRRVVSDTLRMIETNS